MDWPSGFFIDPNESDSAAVSILEPLPKSGGGAFRLYKGDSDGRYIVYKAIVPELRGDRLYEDLLRKEYEIGSTLDHPNIRRYISFGAVEGLGNAIGMEWVDGLPLDEFRIPDRKSALRLLSALCDALEYIHERQIVHRDLKPSNVLITSNGNNVRLIDFGFSDADSWSLLKTPAGTLSYASPEQLAGEPLDCRSDIYSLGLIIKEILPRDHGVAARCLRLERERRFSSAGDVRRALLKNRALPAIAAAGVIAAVAVLLTVPRRPDVPVEMFEMPEVAVDTSISSIEDIFEEATRLMLDADGAVREP